MHQRDAIGDRVHLLFACLGLIAMFGPVTVTEIAFAPLAVFFLIRAVNTFPLWIHSFGQPTVLIAIALACWMMISLSWSPDPKNGWNEISELRWILLVGFIYPVIERRKLLILSMCIGIGFGMFAQLFDAFDGFGVNWIANLVANHPNRIAGWWHPVVGGGIFVAALGLSIPPAFAGVGRTKIFGRVMLLLCGISLIATGTRGAWVAGFILVLLSMLYTLITGKIKKKQAALILLVSVILITIAAFFLPDSVQSRINETRNEIQEVLDGRFDSYSGIRVQMAQTAIDEIAQHPFFGVGAGGYQQSAIDEDPESVVHAHAHNGLLQIWSTLGVVGVILWGMLLVSMLRGACLSWNRQLDGIWGLCPMLAIVGLVLASITDSIHINTQTAAMLGALAAMSPAYRPIMRNSDQTQSIADQHRDK